MVVLAYFVIVLDDLGAGRVERSPCGVLRKGERVKDSRYVTDRSQLHPSHTPNHDRSEGPVGVDSSSILASSIFAVAQSCVCDLPSHTWISVDPPSPSNPGLSFKDSELVESELLLQLTCHGNTGSTSTDDDDWVVCVRIMLVAVHSTDRLRYHYR